MGWTGTALPMQTSFTSRQVFEAFQKAYPGICTDITAKNGDIALKVRGQWFYWANGRLLPEGQQDRWEEFDPYAFYRYPKTLSDPPTYSDSERMALLEATYQMDLNPVSRNPAFFNALWRCNDYQSSYERVKTVFFLGLKADVHRELLEDVAAVEEEILEAAKNDAALRQYLANLWQIAGYNWRAIAGTYSLSFHSYGIALDVLPVYYAGMQVYWRWSRQYYPEWFSIPLKGRYMPHPAVIEAFEHHGFVWGGKWLYFDNIHFEYRPEILLLNGFTLKDEYARR